MTGTDDAVPDAAGADIAPGTDGQPARELLDLQRTAYAVEAALIGDDRIPPLHETSADLRRAALQRRGAFLGPRLVGAAAWTDEPQLVDIDRLVVAPDVHRRGIASALVRHVLERAGRRPTVVATGRDNTPARTLYERLGFIPTAAARGCARAVDLPVPTGSAAVHRTGHRRLTTTATTHHLRELR